MDLSSSTMLRFAAFTGLKRLLLADQTIEPTTIAGFNQFFDDADGAEHVLYGAGLDHKINDDVSGGAEYYFRELQHPIEVASGIKEEEYEENFVQLYLNWVLNKNIAVDIKYQLELFRVDGELVSVIPEEMKTQILPIRLSYSHPSGFVGRLVTKYVSQEIEWFVLPEIPSSDDFLLVDIAIGYRLPKRYGLLSLDIRNVFDEEFNFMDSSLRSSQEFTAPMFLPQRTILFRLMLSF